jgi:glycosyltransferase involved in cell wall biosynthesis
MNMKVSVAICTWNRAELLDQTLSHLRLLRIPEGIEWELLVVNNNCTDGTDGILKKYSGEMPLRRLFEPKQGLSNARNCAVANATGELLLWTDDDVLVDPEWMSSYVAGIRRFPEASFFGGTVEPWFAVEPPSWIREHLPRIAGTYAIRDLGDEVRPLAANEVPYGANMAFRLQALRGMDFNPRLGRIGAGMLSGDETDLIARLRQMGHQGVWIGTARVKHYIPQERMTKQYVWAYYHGISQTMFRQQPVWEGTTLLGAPRWAIRKYWEAQMKALLFAPFHGSKWIQAYLDTAYYRGIIDAFRELNRA